MLWHSGAFARHRRMEDGMARYNGTPDADGVRGTTGADVMYGRGGNDRLAGNSGNDSVYGDAGNDILWGDNGNDRLYGGSGQDQLVGGAGNDRLQGGTDNDKYWGGAGNDRFVFSDVPTGNRSTHEQVFDYQQGEVLDFSLIDADWTRPGNQAFHLVRDGSFNGRPGEMIIDFAGTGTNIYNRIYLDTNGDASADMFVTLENGWFSLNPGQELIL